MKRNLTFCLLIVLTLASCESFNVNHLIRSKAQCNEVSRRFTERVNFIQPIDSSINSIIRQKMPQKEREAFQFLYAYMPLCDLTMHTPNYVHQQVKTALLAQKTFKWGKKVPKEIFLHFVLPYRANNEYTDNARQIFFDELKPRIQGMSMYNAALEVNHWCHEKANYRPSDSRTSGPETVVRTGYGRCGEESTFTVAALRAVGIPARQVYTPRWAHTDDNHAWVEVWVDGKWYFMGACEPDPELNMGWFAGPSKRTMMTRTFVYGKYFGKEEKLSEGNNSAELNLLANYADTKNLTVKVVDEQGKIVPNAKVEYQLYNYSEFYPIARKTTNNKGFCTIRTGFGDLMIWANLDNKYGFAKADRLLTDTLTVKLAGEGNLTNINIELIPPAEKVLTPADEQKAAQNNKRLKDEDEIRSRYEATFIDSVSAANLAMEKGVSIESTWNALRLSRGNWKEIKSFIEELEGKDLTVGMAILQNIAEKDLHDISATTLRSHVSSSDLYPSLVDVKQFDVFDKYVLSPRISREFITNWREYIQKSFTYEEIGFFRNNPENIASWIVSNIKIDNESNYYNVPISPDCALKYRIADKHSRDILFVAICRSFGIPARLEPATKKPQYLMKGNWNDILFEPAATVQPKGYITLQLEENSIINSPQYYTHYTIAKLQNGRFETLDYENSSDVANFPAKIEVETGKYRMVTGNRQSNGTVLCSISYFSVEEGKNIEVPINFMKTDHTSNVAGTIDLNLPIKDLSGQNVGAIVNGGYSDFSILAIVAPGTEPTNHLLNDLANVATEINTKTSRVLLVVAQNKLTEGFENHVSGLPSNTTFCTDQDGTIAQAIATGCNKNASTNYPIVTAINANGEIIFYSEGYSIGLGDQIIKSLK